MASTEQSQQLTTPLVSKDVHGDDSGQTYNSTTFAVRGNSPVEQVALTVPVDDDPSVPVLTFRMWALGTISCVVLSFLNQFFCYRSEPLSITSVSAQIAVVPLGHLMALTLTDRVFLQGNRWQFTLNPGPFNVKEHVLITIFANSGAGSIFAMSIVSAVKIFYKQNLTFFVSLILIVTTQVLGYGWAGIFRRYLVEPATMWWPQNLVQVSLFRALHEKERIRLITVPVMLSALAQMPPATTVNYITWIIVGFLFGFVIYRYRRDWWQRHNYLLSGALDAGLAFMAVLLYLCLEFEGIKISWWSNKLDGCTLASCPTAKGVHVAHCPVP